MFDACFTYDDHLRANGHWVFEDENAAELFLGFGVRTVRRGDFAVLSQFAGGVVQLVRPPACQAGGRSFERPHIF